MKIQPIYTWMIQIAILANHQNGKDTHVRSCLVWGPRENTQQPVKQHQVHDEEEMQVLNSVQNTAAHGVFASLR